MVSFFSRIFNKSPKLLQKRKAIPLMSLEKMRCPMTIVIATIIINNNKVMIARRGKNQKLPGKWEFLGGKLKSGESMEDCLTRELKEELNMTVEVSDYFG